MLIVIEGADGAGKTTIAEAIGKKIEKSFGLKVEQKHSGPPADGEDLVSTYLSTIGDYSPDGDKAMIIDRLHWGETIYGPLYRPEADIEGYGSLGPAGFRYVELYVVSRGGVVVHVDVKEATARRRAEERGEDFTNLDDLEQILTKYRVRYLESNGGIRVVNEEDEPLAQIAGTIISNAMSRKHAYKDLTAWPSYVGTCRPLAVVLMPPDQKLRLKLLGKLTENEWPHVGIASSDMPGDQVTELLDRLGNPALKILTTARPGGPAYASHGTGAVVSLEHRTRFDDLDELVRSVQHALHDGDAMYSSAR